MGIQRNELNVHLKVFENTQFPDEFLNTKLINLYCKHMIHTNLNKDSKANRLLAASHKAGYEFCEWGSHEELPSDLLHHLNIITKMEDDDYRHAVRIVICQYCFCERPVIWSDNLHSTIKYIREFGKEACLRDIPFYVIDFWHRGNLVCCIKSEGMIATSVFFIIENELKNDFTTYSGIIKFLNATNNLDVSLKPSILKTFENVLFSSYSDAVVKYKEMLTVFPKFTPAFKELFAEEMNALAVSNTSIQIKPDLSKIYISEEHEYCYIAATSPDSVYMKWINTASFGNELDYRELQKFTVDTEAFNELHSLLLTALHDLSSVIRVDNLPKVNGGSIKYYNESDRMDQSYTIASPNFQLRIYALIGISCHLNDNSRMINTDKKCQATDIIDIFSGYNNNTKCIHDFLVSLMKAFAPILLGDLALRKQLFDYLYTLEDGDNSVNAQQKLPDNTDSLPHK